MCLQNFRDQSHCIASNLESVNVWLPTDLHRSARGRDWIPLEPWPFQDLWGEPAVASNPNSSVLDSSGRGLYYQNEIITSWNHGMSAKGFCFSNWCSSKLLQPVEVLQHPDAQQGGDLMPHSRDRRDQLALNRGTGKERKRQDACAETRPPSASVLSSIVVVRGLFGEVIFFLNLSYWTCIYIYISFFLQWSVCCNKFTLPSTNNICFFSSLLHLTDSTATFPKGVLSLQTEFNWKLRLESAQ